MIPKTLTVLAAAAVLAGPAAAADTGALTVTFQGLTAQKGAILLSLVSSEAAYDDKAPAAGQAMVAVNAATAEAAFAGLAPGRYAIRAFHDVNGDGKMGANPFGMPTEPYGFSNNAKAMMGPPKWADAAFEVTAGQNTHTITLD